MRGTEDDADVPLSAGSRSMPYEGGRGGGLSHGEQKIHIGELVDSGVRHSAAALLVLTADVLLRPATMLQVRTARHRAHAHVRCQVHSHPTTSHRHLHRSRHRRALVASRRAAYCSHLPCPSRDGSRVWCPRRSCSSCCKSACPSCLCLSREEGMTTLQPTQCSVTSGQRSKLPTPTGLSSCGRCYTSGGSPSRRCRYARASTASPCLTLPSPCLALPHPALALPSPRLPSPSTWSTLALPFRPLMVTSPAQLRDTITNPSPNPTW